MDFLEKALHETERIFPDVIAGQIVDIDDPNRGMVRRDAGTLALPIAMLQMGVPLFSLRQSMFFRYRELVERLGLAAEAILRVKTDGMTGGEKGEALDVILALYHLGPVMELARLVDFPELRKNLRPLEQCLYQCAQRLGTTVGRSENRGVYASACLWGGRLFSLPDLTARAAQCIQPDQPFPGLLDDAVVGFDEAGDDPRVFNMSVWLRNAIILNEPRVFSEARACLAQTPAVPYHFVYRVLAHVQRDPGMKDLALRTHEQGGRMTLLDEMVWMNHLLDTDY